MKATAFANDTVVLLSWLPEAKIPECLGFAITRVNARDGTEEVLESYVPFRGQSNPDWLPQPTTVWPIQKFTWMDFGGKLFSTYKYVITPMTGTFDALTVRTDLAVTTEAVSLTTQVSDQIKVAFTRGILSTQWLARTLPTLPDGTPDFEALIKAIKTPGDPIRTHLMGNCLELFKEQIAKAKEEGGHVYQLFYELTDPELVAFMMDHLDVFSLILSNTGKDDETNKWTRRKLHEADADIIDRMLEGWAIGHNKCQVRVNKRGRAVAVQGGTLNPTATGFCCQSNTVISIEDAGLARIYREYWKLVKADKAKMGPKLRAENARKKEVRLKDGTHITVWFSPNMPTADRPRENPPTPPDLAEVFAAMDAAKQGVFFLAFYPGFPSIISHIAGMNETRRDLILRGAVSSSQAMPKTELFHRPGELPVMVSASGLEEEFANWRKELLKLPDSHAIIHDKLVVIDPFSDEDCVVIITSHNMGFKASYANDENMMIIRGNRRLAMYCLVHILDVYNHYRFRSAIAKKKTGFRGFLGTTDRWQNKYFQGPAHRELELFTGTSILRAA